ncbi:type IV pilin protein [Undibacterium seohonense]|jgi:type IV pilus assembly protein PilE|uniref:Type IV pilin protein n=1 Tax=Undibacterium seohonense TaxID=1344950 RepID=A0ABR6X596_9BURK|nr:type IV pilin protein [Undibacterium seohonense]MBC3807760.1 type IV pilin protein [Undibacterium seohonense]
MILFKRNEFRGFTLIEVLIAMTILAIVSAIAYPSYRDNVRRGNRAEVRGLLLENAQFMERFFTENSSYLQTAAAVPVPPVLPNLVSPRGATGSKVNYNISFRAVPALSVTTFAIQAVPTNGMATDACATLTINSLGQQGTVGSLKDGMTTETCWAK